MASLDIDPLRLLQEDLKDDDHEQVITSVGRLTTVAHALGPARTRAELIPFLAEYLECDNDEALTLIARQLGDFAELVGGSTYVPVVLPLLEKLSSEEEYIVREAAVGSMCTLCQKMSKADVMSRFVPVLKKLAHGDWFTTRVSSCSLFHIVYPLVSEALQVELRSMFLNLCNDDTPMVRKAAYTNLGKFASVLQKSFLKSDILPLLKSLAQDDSDVMRPYAVDCCVALGPKMDAADYAAHFVPLLDVLQDDVSWRVRQHLAKEMANLCVTVNEHIASKRLMPIFAKLLKDREAEVRVSACNVLPRVAEAGKNGLLDYVAPLLDALAVDPIVAVRVAFAQAVGKLCGPFGKDVSQKLLVPLIQQLSKDDHHDVRNFILANMEPLTEAIGAAGISSSILPSLLELSKDAKWRVRMTVVDNSSLLARLLGQKLFEKKLQPVLITCLSDHVYAIRERTCEQLGEVVKILGGKWAADKLFPSAFAIYDKTTNYLHRMTCLLLLHYVAPHCQGEVAEKSLLPIALTAATDEVANVRISGAKALGDLINQVDRNSAVTKIRPALAKLAKDTDPDVSHFASLALASCPSA